MAVAAVADQVDDDVVGEGGAVVDRHRRHLGHRLEVLAVDVEDGDRQPPRDVGGEARGVQVPGLGGEADQVVDDDVDRAADVEAGEVGQVERLGERPLAGEGGVAVEEDRHHLPPRVAAAPRLLGAHPADGDRIDRLEVAGVGDQVDRQLAAVAGAEGAGRAHVVLDVAGPHDAARIDVLEAGEDLGRGRARRCGP